MSRSLGTIPGEYTIRLQPGAIPYAITAPRRVPIPLMKRLKQEIERLVRMGIIRKVDGPTDWCAGIVLVTKQSGELRVCVDLTKLNKCVVRERFTLPTVEQALGSLAGAKWFSKLDAFSGFHQVRLSRDSEELTTFLTPFGRYCFTRLPFGITSAPEYFQKRMSEILCGLPGVVNVMDDILVFGNTKAQHDERLADVMSRLASANVTLNKEKCLFGVNKLRFLGHILNENGIEPDPAKVSAIKNLNAPKNVTELRSLLGMANHLGRFLPHLAQTTAPMRALLHKGSEWVWGCDQAKAFNELKELICSAQCMAMYDATLPTILSADASSFGLGAVLFQTQKNGHRRPIAFASRSLTNTERRYSQIEKEALALTWAAERFDEYIRGINVTFETDHKPLVSLLGQMAIDDMPLEFNASGYALCAIFSRSSTFPANR